MQQENSVLQKQTAKVEGQKQKLINTNSIPKSVNGHERGCFQELEKEIVEFVHVKGKTGVPIACNTKLAKSRNIMWHHVKASIG